MIAAVVLAAGQSNRMGQPKQLLTYQSKTLLQQVLHNLLQVKVDEIVVVLGHAAEQVACCLHGLPVKSVLNSEYMLGLSTSLQAGLRAVLCQGAVENNRPLAGLQAILFVLGDQPLVKSATLAAIVTAYRPGKIVVPYYQGRRGNPVLLDSSFFGEIEELRGDVGAREIIKRHPDRMVKVEVSDPGVIQDIDTWQDYLQLKDSP